MCVCVMMLLMGTFLLCLQSIERGALRFESHLGGCLDCLAPPAVLVLIIGEDGCVV